MRRYVYPQKKELSSVFFVRRDLDDRDLGMLLLCLCIIRISFAVANAKLLTHMSMHTFYRTTQFVLTAAGFIGLFFASAAPTSAASWLWPTTARTISYKYFEENGFGGRPHFGIDIDGVTGDPIYASRSGIVTRVDSTERFGLRIRIQHGKNRAWRSTYRHLDSVQVTVGQRVKQGDVIGTMGNTGFSTGDHLHFGIAQKVNGVWTSINPLDVISQ